MKWVGNIVGVLLSLMGLIWILQGTDVLKAGFMAGHLQYAFYGLIALVVGVALLVLSNRRRSHPSGGGSAPHA